MRPKDSCFIVCASVGVKCLIICTDHMSVSCLEAHLGIIISCKRRVQEDNWRNQFYFIILQIANSTDIDPVLVGVTNWVLEMPKIASRMPGSFQF